MVESKYRPVSNETLYSMVPEKLFSLRNASFISLARIKMYASYSLKNLFGMIPDPLRPYWHGSGNQAIAQSILDINKIYHALFNVFGMCEAIFTLPVNHPKGRHAGVYSGRYDILEGSGLVACGRNLAALDALLLYLTDPLIRLVAELNRRPIDFAENELGLTVDRTFFDQAKTEVGGWFSPP
jgi:uncharacterized protein (DUF362 family)